MYLPQLLRRRHGRSHAERAVLIRIKQGNCGIDSHKTRQMMSSKIESTVDEKQQNSHVDIAPVRRDDGVGQRR